MADQPPPGAQQPQLAALPLHAVWWQVLKPKAVMLANGQPAYDIVATVESLAEATAHVRAIPGGVIVQNVAVFINPLTAPLVARPS